MFILPLSVRTAYIRKPQPAMRFLDGSKSRKARIGRETLSDSSRHEPFCTVLLEQVSESIGVSKGQFARQTRRPELPSRNRAGPDTAYPALRSSHEAAINNRLRADRWHIVRAGPRRIMLLASKIGSVGITLTLLTTGMLAPRLPQGAPGSDSIKKGVAVFVVKNEIKKVQETLRNKGHYAGQVDGVFGLRTRASIRAYQTAESLPITGQVDTRTAAELGVRPESNWDNSQSARRQVG